MEKTMNGIQTNICERCGVSNPSKNRFCSKCGNKILSVAPVVAEGVVEKPACGKCGHVNELGARICNKCYTPLVNLYQTVDEGDYVLVKLNLDHIDFDNHRDLALLLRPVKNAQVVMDMTAVKWVDSTGVGALVSLCSRFAHEHRELKLFGVTPRVLQSFRALQVDNVVELYHTKNEVLASWGLPPVD